uniref:Uncharacterized protein n=1 Tax=Amphora coffeiformis TaxID=265554 RepID=A0A7S3L0X8_9STRA
MFSNRFLSTLAIACLTVTVSEGFAPSASTTSSSALFSAFDGKKFDPGQNPLSRGGKNSWEFELDSMYIEEKPKKKTAAVSPKKKVVTAKSTSFGAFGQKAAAAAKKTPSAAKPAATNPLASLFGKPKVVVEEKKVTPPPKTNPLAALFGK